MITLNEAHIRAVHGDRDLVVSGRCRGFWAQDHVLDFVAQHRYAKVWVMAEDRKEVVVKLAEVD